MIVRELGVDDLAALSEFIIDVYNEYPQAMWFESEPSAEEMERVFYSKIKGVGSRALVDVVTEDNGTIAGECEVARVAYDSGVVGIIVRHGYRRKGLGSSMLDRALGLAYGIGMRRLSAEVMEGNSDALKFFISRGFRPEGQRRVERNGIVQRFVVVRLTR